MNEFEQHPSSQSVQFSIRWVVHKGEIIMALPIPCDSICLTPDQARAVAARLLELAQQLDPAPELKN